MSAEIEMIRTHLGSEARAKPDLVFTSAGKRKPKSAAQRKAQSDKMKAYWANRKKSEGKEIQAKPKKEQPTSVTRKLPMQKEQAKKKNKSRS